MISLQKCASDYGAFVLYPGNPTLLSRTGLSSVLCTPRRRRLRALSASNATGGITGGPRETRGSEPRHGKAPARRPTDQWVRKDSATLDASASTYGPCALPGSYTRARAEGQRQGAERHSPPPSQRPAWRRNHDSHDAGNRFVNEDGRASSSVGARPVTAPTRGLPLAPAALAHRSNGPYRPRQGSYRRSTDGDSLVDGDHADAKGANIYRAGSATGASGTPRWRPRLRLRPSSWDSDPGSGSRSSTGSMSYSKRVALLRKPALTAADKLSLSPEERASIFRALRTPSRDADPFGVLPPGHPPPPRLRVFCYGIDDVRLYKAAEGAGLLGRLLVARDVEGGDAVLASRTKRTGRAVELKEMEAAARNAGKPFVELPALSPVRLAEAVEALTGWPVPHHLRERPPPPVTFLPRMERDGTGSAAALRKLTSGLSLSEYIASRPDYGPTESLLRELDRTDLYDSREALLPVNPQEREARRVRPPTRPHMDGSRLARKRMLRQQLRRRAEAEGQVPW